MKAILSICKKLLLFSALLLFIAGCLKEDNQVFILDGPEEIIFPDSPKEAYEIRITSSEDWTAVSSENWCTLSRPRGHGWDSPIPIMISCEANPQGNGERECAISIASKGKKITIKVVQREARIVTLSQDVLVVTEDAQSVTLGFTANTTVSIDNSDSPWFSAIITNETEFVVVVESNTDIIERQGKIAFKDEDGKTVKELEIIQLSSNRLIMKYNSFDSNFPPFLSFGLDGGRWCLKQAAARWTLMTDYDPQKRISIISPAGDEKTIEISSSASNSVNVPLSGLEELDLRLYK